MIFNPAHRPSRRPFLGVVILISVSGAVAAEAPAVKTPQSVTAEQRAKIDAAKTPEELIKLGSQFFASPQKQHSAAIACIEKAVKLRPELLTDVKRQQPKPWSDFWFVQRAALGEAALSKEDAAGRVKIALWLREAGLAKPAVDVLRRALTIDKNLPEAQNLAKEWNLNEGAPMRFDLRLGLTQPLLMSNFKDQGQDLAPRKNCSFLLLPFEYNPTDTPLTINKPLMKAISDDGKPCAIKGIALLERGSSSPAPGSGDPATHFDFKLPQNNDPLWEKIQAERKADTGEIQLGCFNTTPAMVPPPPRNPRERGQPAARRPVGADDGSGKIGAKQELAGTGYAAFLIEVPQSMTSVTCEYRSVPPLQLQLEASFLSAVTDLPGGATPQQRDRLADELLPYTVSKEGPIAAAAIGKLALLRSGTSPQVAGAADPNRPAGPNPKIDRALIAAMGHADELTRTIAFGAIIPVSTPPTDAMLELIRSFPEVSPLLAMLEVVSSKLAGDRSKTAQNAQPAAPAAPGVDVNSRAVDALPASTAPVSLFAVLGACLNHQDTKVREQATEVIISDGTRESVTVLTKAGPDARDVLIPKLAKITNNELKAAIVRVLLIRADAATAAKLLASCGDLAVTMKYEDDPLLTALVTQTSPESIQKLLELLGRSDLSTIAGSEKFKKILEGLVSNHANPAVHSAMLKLALSQFNQPYEAPIKRERQQSGTTAAPVSGFESMLVALALGKDAQTAKAAAEALFLSGRIQALSESFGRTVSSTHNAQREMLSALIKDKKFWEQEALAVFLASRLTDKEAKNVKLSLSALEVMQSRIDAKSRWRFNLGVKQGLDAKQLTELTGHADGDIGQAATSLLIRLAMMPTAEESDFRSATDAPTRSQKLTTIEQSRAAKPAGRYACILYVDVMPVDPAVAGGAAVAAGSSSATGPKARSNIPLIGPPIALQEAGGRIIVTTEGRELQMSPPPDAQPQGESAPQTLRINVGPLLRAALTSPEAEKQGLTDKIDVLMLNDQRECAMKYEQLGTFSGELNITDDKGVSSDKPLRISGAKIVFEPLPPN